MTSKFAFFTNKGVKGRRGLPFYSGTPCLTSYFLPLYLIIVQSSFFSFSCLITKILIHFQFLFSFPLNFCFPLPLPVPFNDNTYYPTVYTAISINVFGSKYKATRQDQDGNVHQNQLCLVCPVKINDDEPFG